MSNEIEVVYANSNVAKRDRNKIISDFPKIHWSFANKICLALLEFLIENECIESLPQLHPFCKINDDELHFGIQFQIDCNLSEAEILFDYFINFISNHDNTIVNQCSKNVISLNYLKIFLSKKNGKSIKSPLIIFFNGKKYFLNGSFSTIELTLNTEIRKEIIIGRVVGIYRSDRRVIILSNKVEIEILYDLNYHLIELIELFSNEQSSVFNVDIQMNAKQIKIITLRGINNSFPTTGGT